MPTLNEAAAMGAVIDELLEMGVPTDNILVVDGDTGSTVDVVKLRGVFA